MLSSSPLPVATLALYLQLFFGVAGRVPSQSRAADGETAQLNSSRGDCLSHLFPSGHCRRRGSPVRQRRGLDQATCGLLRPVPSFARCPGPGAARLRTPSGPSVARADTREHSRTGARARHQGASHAGPPRGRTVREVLGPRLAGCSGQASLPRQSPHGSPGCQSQQAQPGADMPDLCGPSLPPNRPVMRKTH